MAAGAVPGSASASVVESQPPLGDAAGRAGTGTAAPLAPPLELAGASAPQPGQPSREAPAEPAKAVAKATSGPSSLASRRNRPGLQVQKAPEPASSQFAPPARSIRKLEAPETLEGLFDFQEKLYDSAASNSQVLRALCRTTGKEMIIKTRRRRFAVGGERVWRSLLNRMLNLEAHMNVLGLHDVVEDSGHYYIIMERCSGGELFDFLQTETDVPERECKRIMREILEAVDHIHTRGLIHRDIKPENIMFHDHSGDPATPKTMQQKKAIKLIDFDTCQEYEPNSPKAKHIVGTMGYIAPEALKGDYGPASDLWSVGVILYILMTGDMPFSSDVFGEEVDDTRIGSASMNGLHDRLKGAHIDFECEPWPSFPQARDLCQKLLAFSPGDRSPSARAALQHPWLSGK